MIEWRSDGMLYYYGSKIVGVVGLEEAIVLLFGGMLLCIYVVWMRLQRLPGPVWRLGVFVPLFMSFFLSITEYRGAHETIALLQHTDSLSEPQKNLMLHELVRQTASVIGIGIVFSALLWWLVFRSRAAIGGRPGSTGTREEENAKPV